MQLEPPRFHLVEIEHVADQPDQPLGVPTPDAHQFLRLRRQPPARARFE